MSREFDLTISLRTGSAADQVFVLPAIDTIALDDPIERLVIIERIRAAVERARKLMGIIETEGS